MAKISLRAYNKEIESLIDRGQNDQALAHCRHILKSYPKHIDTYRLMAKAYIEAQRYGDASDVFQRVLSSIPDDFVSHLGMSIIREDEGNLDAAIWHMERAFEIQPANAAIQSELRRLYGRRDGIEPPKVRLTRGALARMYFKGELYHQAISELRTALSTDLSRTDLQVLLVQSYYRSGQRVEAVDTCTAILKKLPYCIEANRILAEILAASDRANDAPAYRQRAISLNPYLGQVSPRAPTPDKVPDEAVWLEKLDYVSGPGELGTPGQPQWAASIGVQIETPTASQEEVPDWLNELEAITQTPAPEQAPEIPKVSPFVPSAIEQVPELAAFSDKWTEAGKPNDEELIPDWMKEAGWLPSSDSSQAAEQGFNLGEEGSAASGELTPAEIPSWLRAMAPKEALEGTMEEGEEIDPRLAEVLDSSALPWLQETPPGPTEPIANWLVDKEKPALPFESASAAVMPGFESPEELEPSSAFGSGAPDWLQELEKQTGLAEPSSPKVEEEGLPDWLKGGAAAAAGIGIAVGAKLLGDDQAETSEAGGKEMRPAEAIEGEAVLGEEPVPEWLTVGPADAAIAGSAMGAEFLDQVQEQAPVQDEIPSPTSEPEQAALPWDEMDLEGPAPTGEIPDWLKELGAPGTEPPGEIEARVPAAEPLPISQSEWVEEGAAFSLEVDQALSPTESGPGELAGFVAMGAAVEAAFTPPEGTQPGEWEPETLEQPVEVFAAEAAAIEPEIPVEDSLPEWLRQASIESETESSAAAEDTSIPEWLRQMDEGLEQPVEAELAMLQTADFIPEEHALDWLAEAGELEPLGAQEMDWLTQTPAADLGMELPDEFISTEEGVAGILPIAETEEIEAATETTLPDWLAAAAAGAAISEFARADTEEVISPESGMEAEISHPLEPVSDEIPAWLEETGRTDRAGTVEPVIEEPTAIEPAWLEVEEPAIIEGDTQPRHVAAAVAVPVIETVSEPDADLGPLEEPEIGEPEAVISAVEPVEAGLSDEEEAFAWLESLAVRQGADEALMYSEEQRPDEPPDWVKQSALEAEASDAIPALQAELETPVPESDLVDEGEPSVPGWLLGAAAAGVAAVAVTAGESAEKAPEVEEPAYPGAIEEVVVEAPAEVPGDRQGIEPVEGAKITASDSEMDAAFAWLESLAVRQGADEALMYTEEERTEEPPDWVQKAAVAAAGAEVAAEMHEEITAQEVEGEARLPDGISVESEAQLPPEALKAEEFPTEELFTPISVIVETPGEALLPEEPVLATEIAPIEAEKETIPELPPWLADLAEEPDELAGEAGWLLPEADAVRLDINQASLVELERLPGVGFVRAQALIDYRNTHGAIDSLDDLSAIEEFDSDVIEGLRNYTIFPEGVLVEPDITPESPLQPEEQIIIEPVAAVMETVAEPSFGGVEGEILLEARSEFNRANPQAAIQKYQSLIQSEKLLPEVVKDLHDGIYRFPVDISLWMALGDAQMRSGQIQEALDAYTRAEELMR